MPSEQMQDIVALLRAAERDRSIPIEQARTEMEAGAKALPAGKHVSA